MISTKRILGAVLATLLALVISACGGGSPTGPTQPPPVVNVQIQNIRYQRTEVNSPDFADWPVDVRVHTALSQPIKVEYTTASDVVQVGDDVWQSALGFNLPVNQCYKIFANDRARTKPGVTGSGIVGERIWIQNILLTKMDFGSVGGVEAVFKLRSDGSIDPVATGCQ